jgi:chromosome segregation ATPase
MVTDNRQKLAVGDAVMVPWGLDELRGRVLEMYGEPGSERAVVAVEVPGSTGEDLGEVTITYRISELEPPGTLDLLADLEEELPRLPTTLDEATAVINSLGEIAGKYTERTNRANERGEGARARLALLASYAQEIEPYAIRLDELSKTFAEQVEAIEAGVISLLREISTNTALLPEAQPFLAALRDLAANTDTALRSTEGFYTSISGLENLSKQLRPRMRLLKQATLRLIAYFRRITSLGERAAVVPPTA